MLAALARDQIPVGRPALRPRTPAFCDLALKARQVQALTETAEIRRREDNLAANELHARMIGDSGRAGEALQEWTRPCGAQLLLGSASLFTRGPRASRILKTRSAAHERSSSSSSGEASIEPGRFK